MADKRYFTSLFVLPAVIDGSGKYATRCGEGVEIAQSSSKHDFGCIGTYSNGTTEHWHKSGRLFSSRETANDVVAKHGTAV